MGKVHQSGQSFTALLLSAVLVLNSCHPKQNDSINDVISDYSARLEKDAKSVGGMQVSEETRAKATKDRSKATEAMERSRSTAQSEAGKLPDPIKKEVEDCLADMNAPQDASPTEINQYGLNLTKCKEAAKKAEKFTAKPGFGNSTKAFRDFIRWAEIVGAIVSIAYGNYPLAAMLVKAASEGGGEEESSKANKPGEDIPLSNPANASDGTADGKPVGVSSPADLPSGWASFGSARDGLTIAHSPDFRKISFEGAGVPRIEIDLSSEEAKPFMNGALRQCDDLHARLLGTTFQLFIQSKSGDVGGCPNVALTYDPLSKPSIKILSTATPGEVPHTAAQ